MTNIAANFYSTAGKSVTVMYSSAYKILKTMQEKKYTCTMYSVGHEVCCMKIFYFRITSLYGTLYTTCFKQLLGIVGDFMSGTEERLQSIWVNSVDICLVAQKQMLCICPCTMGT